MTERTTIEVQINGQLREVPDGLSVTGLLEWLNLNPSLVVVELNRGILHREKYGSTQLRAADALELVHFVGGG